MGFRLWVMGMGRNELRCLDGIVKRFGSLGYWRTYDNFYALGIAEILIGHLLGVLEGHFFNLGLTDLVMIVAKAEQFVSSTDSTKCRG